MSFSRSDFRPGPGFNARNHSFSEIPYGENRSMSSSSTAKLQSSLQEDPIVQSQLQKSSTMNLTYENHPNSFPSKPELDASLSRKTDYNTLACIEIDSYGKVSYRDLTRSQILNEIRSIDSTRLNDDIHIDGNHFNNGKKKKRRKEKEKDTKSKLRRYLHCSLQARDIRQVDPAFTPKPALWVRHNAIVVSLGHIRAIILYHKLFLFDRTNPQVTETATSIAQRLAALAYVEGNELGTPFEFKALEEIFVNLCTDLEKTFNRLEPEAQAMMKLRNTGIRKLEEFHRIQQKLKHFSAHIKKLQHVLQELLEDDEEMAYMYLTEIRKSNYMDRDPVDHEEAEFLLESYLQTIDDFVTRCNLISSSLEDTEGLIEIKLDTIQNRLLLVDIVLSTLFSLFGFAGMVTAIFGMNFPFPSYMANLPSSQWYFIGVVVITFFICLVTFISVLVYLRMTGIYGPIPPSFKKDKTLGAEATSLDK